jgi:hypothetical protein
MSEVNPELEAFSKFVDAPVCVLFRRQPDSSALPDYSGYLARNVSAFNEL